MNHFRSAAIGMLVLSMGFGSLASAQDHGRDRDRDRGPPARNERQVERRAPPDRHDRNVRNVGSSRRDDHDQRGNPSYRADNDSSHGNSGYNRRGEWRDQRGEWRGAGPGHDFRRGGYLTPQYRSRQYAVDDWRGHHLTAPPRGYRWVQTGGDYVLAAIATGLIVQILLTN